MKDCCNNCNLKGAIKQADGVIKIRCLYTDEWHKQSYGCGHWKFYDPALSKYERMKLTKASEDKHEEYKRYLECVTTSGLVSILGSATIFIVMAVLAIAAFAIPGILR